MTDILNTPVKQAAADIPPAGSSSTPTVTFHDAGAAQVRAAIAALRQMIPGLRAFHPESADEVRGFQSIPREFIVTACNVAEVVPQLQGSIDVVRTRDRRQFADAYSVAGDDLEALLDDLRFTFKADHAEAAAEGLQTYGIAKTMNRDTSADIATHVANLSRDLGRKRVKPRVKEVPPPQQPQTSH